jgi:hypothetical protein
VKAFLNMSQMTLSQMSITRTTKSPQHKLHWLAKQALNWSGLAVVHARPTSPEAVADVARVVTALLASPLTLTGRRPLSIQ